jgi:hypothetical protein
MPRLLPAALVLGLLLRVGRRLGRGGRLGRPARWVGVRLLGGLQLRPRVGRRALPPLLLRLLLLVVVIMGRRPRRHGAAAAVAGGPALGCLGRFGARRCCGV